jgi:NAD(P)-dependent dehydrogenase (short-subunit alcohol dehydrogenase family)
MSAARNLLVTGGSRGIGAAVARLAARAGWNVAANYAANEPAADAVRREVEALGRRAIAVRADVSRPDEVEAMFAVLDRDFGRIDDLVNNAGLSGHATSIFDVKVEAIRQVIDTNLTGAILVAQGVARRSAKSRGGRGGAIVNISSAAATLGSPGEYVWYAASKGGIDSFTIGLAKELAPEGVRVVSVQPGLIETEIHAASGMPDRLERLGPTVPLGRAGSADEVARTVVFLLSDEASYVTGAILRVSGGR